MLAKIGFILIVLVFGALMFVAGTLAPESVRGSVASSAQELIDRLPLGGKASASSAAATAAAGEETPAAEEQQALIHYETLLLPTPLPEKGQYALQVGLFADLASTSVLADRLQALGYATQAIAVVDQNGQPWVVLAAGTFPSPDAARDARAPVARGLGLARPLTLILLPPEKKKKA